MVREALGGVIDATYTWRASLGAWLDDENIRYVFFARLLRARFFLRNEQQRIAVRFLRPVTRAYVLF